ncbi:TetR-like C-terminal domain-containing protein [Gordonia sp. CPCC 206044]|uniref:TetR-like C-terminal domain-containing protein n=1 Tax=Gordonia sp. CPCC 206044 TaxID=3140793 RepID=UPI003AF39F44
MSSVSTPEDGTARARPGGRSARVRRAVYRAVGDLVEQGRGNSMTIPQVSELAGVNPTSVYRRWGTVDALLGEVAVYVLTRDEPAPDRGDLRADLTVWVRAIAGDIGTPPRRAHLRAMVAARDGLIEQCPCFEFRRDQAVVMIERARERAESTPSVNQVLDHVIAPLYHRAVFGLALDQDFAVGLVDDVMSMTGRSGPTA